MRGIVTAEALCSYLPALTLPDRLFPTLGYVEALCEARTKLAGFFNIPLGTDVEREGMDGCRVARPCHLHRQ